MANNLTLDDSELALNLLANSKESIIAISNTLTESTSPQIRDLLKNQLIACINSHYRLLDIVVSKGWYNAYADPYKQLQDNINKANTIQQQ